MNTQSVRVKGCINTQAVKAKGEYRGGEGEGVNTQAVKLKRRAHTQALRVNL